MKAPVLYKLTLNKLVTFVCLNLFCYRSPSWEPRGMVFLPCRMKRNLPFPFPAPPPVPMTRSACPDSGPLHMLFLLPGTLPRFPWLALSLPSGLCSKSADQYGFPWPLQIKQLAPLILFTPPHFPHLYLMPQNIWLTPFFKKTVFLTSLENKLQ